MADPSSTAPEAQSSARGYHYPALTVDGVVLNHQAHGLMGDTYAVLLVERGRDPFKGCYALPGGFVDEGEDIEDAINREIEEETGLTGLPFRQYRAFGKPDRDPRGHTVSIVYVAVVLGEPPEVTGGDDAAGAGWFPISRLPELAFDHAHILGTVLQTLKVE